MSSIIGLIFRIWVIAILLTYTSCNSCGHDTLPDLIAKSIFVPQTIIFAGETELFLEVCNIPLDDCSNNNPEAASTFYAYSLLMEVDSSERFVEVAGGEMPQESISAGMDVRLPIKIDLQIPGLYRIIAATDVANLVEESDETNNGDSVLIRGHEGNDFSWSDKLDRFSTSNNYYELLLEISTEDGVSGQVIQN